MIYNGVFERYTNLRVAFLEGGSAWLMLLLDRMQRNREAFRVFHDWPIRDYLANGNLLIGKAYTAMLDLQVGDEFTIKLGKKAIRLIPVGGEEEGDE